MFVMVCSYKVVQEDEGRGMDVTLLHHDVGLVRTRTDMTLSLRPPNPLVALRLYNPVDLKNEMVEVRARCPILNRTCPNIHLKRK